MMEQEIMHAGKTIAFADMAILLFSEPEAPNQTWLLLLFIAYFRNDVGDELVFMVLDSEDRFTPQGECT